MLEAHGGFSFRGEAGCARLAGEDGDLLAVQQWGAVGAFSRTTKIIYVAGLALTRAAIREHYLLLSPGNRLLTRVRRRSHRRLTRSGKSGGAAPARSA